MSDVQDQNVEGVGERRPGKWAYLAVIILAFVAACGLTYYAQNFQDEADSAVSEINEPNGIELLNEQNGYNEPNEPNETSQWAGPLENIDGLENAFKVSDDLYRGAQPSAQGFENLEKMGIKTIVNLRSVHSDRDKLKDTSLAYEHIYMKPWHAEDEDIVRFLKIVSDPNRTPVFVHCQHGSDRTGTMCAIYRIAIQNWTVEEALEEMTEGPYGYHEIWENLPEYLRNLDVEKIRKRAGLKDGVLEPVEE